MAALDKFYKMSGVHFGPILTYGANQETALGGVLAEAVTEGRSIELRQDGKAILVLLSAADDMGRVWRITPHGSVTQIGTTEAI